ADVSINVVSSASESERRISPAWTLAQFKTRLEPITGIPSGSQKLELRSDVASVELSAPDDDAVMLAAFPLREYNEIYVHDLRPPSARPNYTDLSAVEKYIMPEDTYASLSDSVLRYKQTNKLGRFAPTDPSTAGPSPAGPSPADLHAASIQDRNITVGARCFVGGDEARRGTVKFVGAVPQLPGPEGAPWVGVELDEPTGKNDGRVAGKRYFDCGEKRGAFARGDRITVGDYPELGLDFGEEMEEI
ncbi:hypothetical protein P152DRAFT_384242, partial [Eremomyces bilateralis CBS 781.70]